jgi:hypothetical protein
MLGIFLLEQMDIFLRFFFEPEKRAGGEVNEGGMGIIEPCFVRKDRHPSALPIFRRFFTICTGFLRFVSKHGFNPEDAAIFSSAASSSHHKG